MGDWKRVRDTSSRFQSREVSFPNKSGGPPAPGSRFRAGHHPIGEPAESVAQYTDRGPGLGLGIPFGDGLPEPRRHTDPSPVAVDGGRLCGLWGHGPHCRGGNRCRQEDQEPFFYHGSPPFRHPGPSVGLCQVRPIYHNRGHTWHAECCFLLLNDKVPPAKQESIAMGPPQNRMQNPTKRRPIEEIIIPHIGWYFNKTPPTSP